MSGLGIATIGDWHVIAGETAALKHVTKLIDNSPSGTEITVHISGIRW